jgi:hypothetical protein
MAKNTKKHTEDDESKPMRLRSVDESAADEGDETLPVVDDADEAEAEKPVVKAASVSMKKGWVRFNCFVDVDPAPVVGHFSFAHDTNVMKLESRQVYSCPLSVAEHLVDKKIGVILPD